MTFFGLGYYALAAQQGQLNMIQDAKRYRALRWLARAEITQDAAQQAILASVPQYEDIEDGDDPTNEQLDAAFDKLVAHLEANGVDLSGDAT